MGIKIYVSGISGNKEVKKRQQRVLMILDSKNIKYEVVDIAEPGNEDAKEFMQNNAKSMGATVGDANPRSPLPPQMFNDEDYCGDYDQFDMANEIDEIEKFLKLPYEKNDSILTSQLEVKLENGETKADEVPKENEAEVKVKEDTEKELTDQAIIENNVDEKVDNKENAEKEPQSEVKEESHNEVKEEPQNEVKEKEPKNEVAENEAQEAEIKKPVVEDDTTKGNTDSETNEENGVKETEPVEA